MSEISANEIKDTIKPLRDALENFARNLQGDDLWQHVQSADHLIEKLEQNELVMRVAGSVALKEAIFYAKALGKHEGAMKSLLKKHPELLLNPTKDKLDEKKLQAIGRDFWFIFFLLEGQIESDKQTGVPGSPGEGSRE